MGAGRTLWSREETILALDLAVGLGASAAVHVHERNLHIRQLSSFLRRASPTVDAAASRHRNEHGVARKVRGLAALSSQRGARGGSAMERALWAEYSGRPLALAAAASEARALLDGVAPMPAPSRGPVPAFGTVRATRVDGRTFLYLARLHGATLHDGRALFKIGRSADVRRRMGELNFGLPGALGLEWVAMAVRAFPDAAGAHAAEQATLNGAAGAGWSAGGEFLALDAEGLSRLAAAFPGASSRSAPRRSPGDAGRLGSAGARRKGPARRRARAVP